MRVLRSNVSSTVVDSVATGGRVFRLGVRASRIAVTDIVALRFQWREFVQQAWFLITVTAVPGVLMSVPFGVIVSAQVGNVVYQLGANSLVGAASGLGVLKQGAPLATGLLLGGAGAAAIAADLGARTIREEIDAIRVLGVDPVQRLIAPRLVAMVAVAPLLNILVVFVGVLAGYVVSVEGLDVTSGSYWESFGSFVGPVDVWVSSLKAVIFGFLVVVIAAQRGLDAKGGPRGVADAVNAAVILSVVSIMVVNTALTQIVGLIVPAKVA